MKDQQFYFVLDLNMFKDGVKALRFDNEKFNQ